MPSVQNIIEIQVRKLNRSLRRVEQEVSRSVALALSEVAEDILYDSNELCPYESGQLRNSARAYLRRGARQERVAWVDGANAAGGGTVKIGGTAGLVAAHEWVLDLYYNRFSRGGFDVALFAHEHIEPGGTGPKKARKPGTQAKFLETAFLRYRPRIERIMADKIRVGLMRFR